MPLLSFQQVYVILDGNRAANGGHVGHVSVSNADQFVVIKFFLHAVLGGVIVIPIASSVIALVGYQGNLETRGVLAENGVRIAR